ncbi:RING finger protein 215 isoform X2 [Carettochelys insculpta]|uniref:RING finger protein 215 isoform X2 n=1 Tax=Carettochelys insculpta TaxID=44489 RepID=UPI003EB6C84A
MARLLLPVLLGQVAALGPALAEPAAARVEVRALREPGEAEPGSPPAGRYSLQGALLGGPGPERGQPRREQAVEGSLVLVGDEPALDGEDSWIGVVPVGDKQAESSRGSKEESFTADVVNKLDVSQVLAKPVIVIQPSDNVTRLLGALLRGLQLTAKISYQAALLENLGVTLTLWSTCGLSRGGLYGEWQGVICTGENSSRVQKYLQQLWNTILLVALLLCTGVIVQAQRQSRQGRLDQDMELNLKQHILQRLSALRTRRYHPGRHPWSHTRDIDSCAVCLDQFHKNQCLRVLPCSHEFHRDCVDPWLLLQQTCPLCKHNILGNCCAES